MAKKQKRLVVADEDLATLEKIADFTRCGSPSIALSLLISRYGEAFIADWKWQGTGNTAPSNHHQIPPPIPVSLSTPLEF